MASIPTSAARQRAIDRIIEVMQAEYENEIAATVTEFEQTSGQLDDLYMPAPGSDAYFYHPDDPDSDNAEPVPHPVAVFFVADSPRQLRTTGSGGPNFKIEYRGFQLNVIVMIRKEPNEPITRNGEALSDNGVLKLRAEIYTGALINCVSKYACSSNEIHNIIMQDDDADLTFLGESLVGVGGAVFEIEQKTKTPTKRPLP
ncbi:MAG: hypothetical protein ACLFVJ_07350 [Persicimonas sp.]